MNRKIPGILFLAMIAACASPQKPSGPTIDKPQNSTPPATPASDQRSADIDQNEPVPVGAEGFFARGNKRFNESKFAGAVADYSEAVKLNPLHASAWHNRAVAKISLKDFPGAIEDATKAIQLNPQYGIAFNSRCWARLQMKQDLPAALTDCNKAIELSPGYVNAYDSRGQLHLELKNKKEAIADLEKALQMDPSQKETSDALAKAKALPDK